MDTIDEILLPDETDGAEESPYRRRRRVVTVRRRRFAALKKILRWCSWLILVLAPLAWGSYWLGISVAHSSLFRLDPAQDVGIEGNHFVSREEIISALGISPAGSQRGAEANIFSLSLDGARRRVESIPWVYSAALSRVYPHRLEVHVVERTPVAFANVGGRLELVDAEGALLQKPDKAFFDFPILGGLGSVTGVAERRSRLLLYDDFSQQLARELPGSGWLISEVDLADTDDLRALLVQGQDTILTHFGHEDFAERFHNLMTSLPELRKTNARIDSVDLRYRNQIVVNPSVSEQRKEERTF